MKTHRIQFALVSLALLAGATGCGNNRAQADKPQMPAAPVRVAPVVSRDMPVLLQSIGNVEAISTVTIKAQISGQLVALHFKEGDYVK